jgi:hypothetical protein
MANQLVGQRAAHSLEKERIVGVLEDAPVSLLLDVLQIIPRHPTGRIFLAHVTETAGKLRQPLAIGALAEPLHLEMFGLQKDWTREEG